MMKLSCDDRMPSLRDFGCWGHGNLGLKPKALSYRRSATKSFVPRAINYKRQNREAEVSYLQSFDTTATTNHGENQ